MNRTPHYTLTLRAEPGHWQAPPEQRLRLALKSLLRAYGLRCTDCRPAGTQNPPTAQPSQISGQPRSEQHEDTNEI
jgi:hypothetical protein